MDLDSQSLATDVTNTGVADVGRYVTSDSLDLVQSKETIEAARQTARNIRRQARLRISVERDAKVSQGHRFEHTVAKGHARVQYGDVYNLGSCTHRGLISEQHNVELQRKVKFEEAKLQAAVVTLLVLNVLEQFLRYLLSVIPRAVGGRISVLEDAFGRTWRIDIDTISSWEEFDGLLPYKFENTRGLQRIRSGNYRLQVPHSTKLIGPKLRPSFIVVFKPGWCVRMSIYFSWDEVRHHGCPKCKTKQRSLPGVETICCTCKFAYTSELQEAAQDISGNLSLKPAILRKGWSRSVGIHQFAEYLDRPENFHRVSIGAPAPHQQTSDSRDSSMPGTPTFAKSVHFYDDDNQTRHFLRTDMPRVVSEGGSPVESYGSDSEFPLDFSFHNIIERDPFHDFIEDPSPDVIDFDTGAAYYNNGQTSRATGRLPVVLDAGLSHSETPRDSFEATAVPPPPAAALFHLPASSDVVSRWIKSD